MYTLHMHMVYWVGEDHWPARMRLDEIEDMAPIEWLARWQLKGLEQVGTENLRARPWAQTWSIWQWDCYDLQETDTA
jgi:hypothetical protein